VVLHATTGAGILSLAAANYFEAGVLASFAALAIVVMLRKDAVKSWALLSAVALLLASAVMTSHSTARLEGSAWPGAMTALHLVGVVVWMGGLPFLVLAVRTAPEDISVAMVKRFSRLAILSVVVVAGSGAVLSLIYIDSWSGLYGTAYGFMVCTKIVLFAIALFLGAANKRIVSALPMRAIGGLRRLRTFGEAEIGIGFTVILAAASLTSQPPAIDLANRPTFDEIVQRFRPETPRLTTPPLAELSAPTPITQTDSSFLAREPAQASLPADIAWSEYNHHWAGIIVAGMGLLALMSRRYPSSLARHWPLMFLGLAVFLVLRADPENWPLGPRSFWQSFLVAEVAQHRLYALLIVLFAAFEWCVQNRRLTAQWPAMVFPLICAIGGALLLTHTHSLDNAKEELFAEMSHTPIAVAGAVAGWTRWLELRLPDRSAFLGLIWPNCLIIVGLVLLFYREA
jgi:copper resistance protein D